MDAGALANILRRPVLPAENTALERLSLSVKLAITVATAHGGRVELARELQALAGRYPVIRLVQSPGAPARLEAGSFRFPIPATLRDALVAAARAPTAATSPSTAASGQAASAAAANVSTSPANAASVLREAPPAAAMTSTAAVARPPALAAQAAAAMPGPATSAAAGASAAGTVATPASAALAASSAEVAALAAASLRAAVQWPAMLLASQAGAPKLRATRDDLPSPRLELSLSGPLLDETLDTMQAAARLTGAVRASGLFTEAQLARMIARGPDEAASQVAAPRDPGRPPVELPLAERSAAQLDVLRRDAAAFVLGAWTGQSARLDVGCERIDADAGAGGAAERARVFFATLKLDLPQLGAVVVRLRLVNSTLAATIETAEPAPWQAALPELAAQLQARGLQPAALAACPITIEDSDACAA